MTVVVFAVARGKTPVAKHVLLAALGGAVAGAVTTATLGAGGTAAAGIGHEVVAFAVGGGSGGAAERLAENALDGRELGEGLASSAAFGAGVGVLSLGAAKGFQAGAARFIPKGWRSTGPPKTLLQKLLAAKTTGTGGSWLRGARAPGTGRGIRRVVEGEDTPSASTDEIAGRELASDSSPLAADSSPLTADSSSGEVLAGQNQSGPEAKPRPARGGLSQALLGR